MSPRIFRGKVFRILTTTVRPKHRVTGEDGKARSGPPLPEAFWYSKVACLLNLEATNETPVFVTDSSRKPFSSSDLIEGRVGRWELGDGSKRESELAVRDGTTVTTHYNQPAEEGISLSAPSPHGDIEKEKQILRERGLL